MRKMFLMLVAAASLTVATFAAPTNAQAYCRGCWIGAGVAGAVIAGAAIANAAPYGYGYGYRPAYYGYPYYYGPRYYALLCAALLRAALLRLLRPALLRAAPLLLVTFFGFEIRACRLRRALCFCAGHAA